MTPRPLPTLISAPEVWRFDERQIRLLRRHRTPMLLLDRIERCDAALGWLQARRCVSVGDVMLMRGTGRLSTLPASLVLEALAQACGFLMGLRWLQQRGHDLTAFAAGDEGALGQPAPGGGAVAVPYSVLAESRASAVAPVHAGDVLLLNSRVLLQRAAMTRFSAEATVDGHPCLRAELSLAYPEDGGAGHGPGGDTR